MYLAFQVLFSLQSIKNSLYTLLKMLGVSQFVLKDSMDTLTTWKQLNSLLLIELVLIFSNVAKQQ